MRRSRSSALVVALAACHHGPVPVAQDCTRTRIADQRDVARLAGCTRVASLTVRTAETLDWTPLAQLAEIDGDLAIGPSLGLEEVQLSVREVRGQITIASNQLMQHVFLRELVHAGGLEVAANVALASLTMPHLAKLDRDLTIDGAALELVEAPELAEVGGKVAIAHVPELTLLELPKLPASVPRAIDAPKLAPAPEQAE